MIDGGRWATAADEDEDGRVGCVLEEEEEGWGTAEVEGSGSGEEEKEGAMVAAG